MIKALTWLLFEQKAMRHSLLLGALIALFESGILLLAAKIDQNFLLPGHGVGLLQHPGIPVIILADFVLLALAAAVARKFLRLARKLPMLSHQSNRRYLRRVVARGRAAVLLNEGARNLFLLSAGLGFFFWIVNAIQTVDPVTYYGNDVFDSYDHPASYIALRAVLGLSWVLIYPYTAVVIFAVSGNIYLATRTLGSKGRLCYKTFHPDKSGGFAYIGDINFLVIMAMLGLYAALVTVIYTHHKLNILQISGFAILSCLFVMLSFLISWPTMMFLFKRKRLMMIRGYRAAGRSVFGNSSISQLIWITTISSFSPYSPYQRAFINAARLAPLAIMGFRLTGKI